MYYDLEDEVEYEIEGFDSISDENCDNNQKEETNTLKLQIPSTNSPKESNSNE